MSNPTLRIGVVEVTALLDGDAELGPIVEAYPDIPAGPLLEWKTHAPGMYGAGDTWRLRVRTWLVRHPGGLLLLDTGLGATSVTRAWFPRPGMLLDALAAEGVTSSDVDTVVISHVHDDHIGGLVTTDGDPVFTNARHVLQSAELRTARADAAESEEDAEIWNVLLRPVEEAGSLVEIEGDERLSDELELHHLPGHTPGHQVLRIASAGDRAILCADTWNHPAQFPNPDWPSGPDRDHEGAAAARRALLAELFSHPETVLAPTHLPEAFGQVVNGKDGSATWRPLPD
jgi:glyoxylase-like metal-dependent hydrolase (beta-lactamase superfamily II)